MPQQDDIDADSVRKLLEIEWQDHFHMRDQTWRTLQIEAALVLGFMGADYKFESLWVTGGIGLLIILSAVSGLLITIHHRKSQEFKFENIIRFEKWLGLITPGLLEGIKSPQPFRWIELLDPTRMNTPIFIMRMHLAVVIFTIIYVAARVLEPISVT